MNKKTIIAISGNGGCRPLIKAIDEYIKKADKKIADKLEAAGYADAETSVSDADGLEDDLASALCDQTDGIIEIMAGAVSVEAAGELLEEYFKDDDTGKIIAEIISEYYHDTIWNLANIYLQETDGELVVNQIRERTSSWIENWSDELSSMMQLTSQNQMKSEIIKSIENGEGISDLTNRLIEDGIRNEQYRARAVSLTEMLRAHSVAQQEAMVQSPSVGRKKWRHTGGYKNAPRSNHVDMDGQIVAVDKPYTLLGVTGGTYYPMYPRDTLLPAEESINCHCLSQPIVDDDILGMDLEERQKLQQQIIEEDNESWKAALDAENKAKAGIDAGEEEDSKPKFDRADTVINRKQIASAAYREKYNLLPETRKVQRKVCASAREMLRHRSGTSYEDLAYIDSKTGNVIINKAYNKAGTSKPNRKQNKMLQEADEHTIIGIHNHPGSSVPSLNDLVVARNRRYKYGMAICHDGTVYKYKIVGELNAINLDAALDFMAIRGYSNDIGKLFLDAGVEMEVL